MRVNSRPRGYNGTQYAFADTNGTTAPGAVASPEIMASRASPPRGIVIRTNALRRPKDL
jgi:hypothetical protein